MEAALVGAIEAGGTKFVCAVGHSPDDFEEVRFPTLSPEETISSAIDFFKSKEKELSIEIERYLKEKTALI